RRRHLPPGRAAVLDVGVIALGIVAVVPILRRRGAGDLVGPLRLWTRRRRVVGGIGWIRIVGVSIGIRVTPVIGRAPSPPRIPEAEPEAETIVKVVIVAVETMVEITVRAAVEMVLAAARRSRLRGNCKGKGAHQRGQRDREPEPLRHRHDWKFLSDINGSFDDPRHTHGPQLASGAQAPTCWIERKRY